MNEKKAIVTLAIGKDFRERWLQICQPNWQIYAERQGYDLICIDEPLDDSPLARQRSPSWQKCLVLSQPFSRRYERVVWVDLDVLINPTAPDITAETPIDKVGAVDEYSVPTRALYATTLAKLYRHWEAIGLPFVRNPTPESFYEVFGFTQGFPQVVQAGVMVLSPEHHRQILEHVYTEYADRGHNWNYEMRPLSYELLQADCVHWLDARFNYTWGLYQALHFPFLLDAGPNERLAACLAEAKQKTYFLHFASDANLMAVAVAAQPETSSRPIERRKAPRRNTQRANWCLDRTPVALFLFNRPETTEKVFAAVRQVRPANLLVITDGPRPDHPEDSAACAAARAIVERVDWPCELLTNDADVNMGLKQRFDSGLDWVFAHFEEAIILEDDCVADPTFFRFCQELLERYRHDERILSISGNNFQFGQRRSPASYYFSRYSHIWGWATWRRAWSLYDAEMARWPSVRDEGWLERFLGDAQVIQYWSYIFQTNYETRENWDYAWLFTSWLHGGLHVLPGVNLVSNHGFGSTAMHTREIDSKFASMLTEPIEFPLTHPDAVATWSEADAFTEEIMFGGSLRQMFARIRRLHAARKLREPT